jgi:NAD(P)-dependent dehydrogenase (short-subunit alcohol dehydrogenase family)
MPDRIRLDGRVAVFTGAAGVIGTATVRLLAERGARIVAVDRRSSRLARPERQGSNIRRFFPTCP